MKRYLSALGLVAGILLLLFFVADPWAIPVLTDPTPWLRQGGLIAAGVGVGLLAADIVLPVPSSLVMMALGAVFGALPGALLSLTGGLGASLLGFAVGRRGGVHLARTMTAQERSQAERLLARWGAVAVVATRPIPILAESVAILAGASAMGWGRMLVASAAGLLPPSMLYALAGAKASDPKGVLAPFVASLLLAALFWWMGRPRGAHTPSESDG